MSMSQNLIICKAHGVHVMPSYVPCQGVWVFYLTAVCIHRCTGYYLLAHFNTDYKWT